ncbi:MAG: hypothetical protein KAR32_05175, partial [Candidatus Omnitrophica bacterium]|nr:hypothetical protein [Candidatus Omnitrophota bacterium]
MKPSRRIICCTLLAAIAVHAGSVKARAQNIYTYTSETIVQNGHGQAPSVHTIFDDQMLLKG